MHPGAMRVLVRLLDPRVQPPGLSITSQTKYYRLQVYLVSRTVARTTDLALAWRAPGATL